MTNGLFSVLSILGTETTFEKQGMFSVPKIVDYIKKLEDIKVQLTTNNLTITPTIESELFELHQGLGLALNAPKVRNRGIHPSGIFYACERAVFYEIKGVATANKVVNSLGLQRTFDYGTWWHSHIQAKILGYLKEFPNKTMGHFKILGFTPEIDVNTLASKRDFISGRCDGIFKVLDLTTKKEIKILLELKTINSFFYSKLHEPLESHIAQANLYREYLGCEAILFVYINKDTSTFKEFFITKQKLSKVPHLQKIVSTTSQKVVSIVSAVRTNIVPERIFGCDNVNCERAKKCPFKTTCYKSPI